MHPPMRHCSCENPQENKPVKIRPPIAVAPFFRRLTIDFSVPSGTPSACESISFPNIIPTTPAITKRIARVIQKPKKIHPRTRATLATKMMSVRVTLFIFIVFSPAIFGVFVKEKGCKSPPTSIIAYFK